MRAMYTVKIHTYKQVERVWKSKWENHAHTRELRIVAVVELLLYDYRDCKPIYTMQFSGVYVKSIQILKSSAGWWINISCALEPNTRIEQMNNFIEYQTKNRISSQTKIIKFKTKW